MVVFLGVKGSSGFEGLVYSRSDSQPIDDPRPYLVTGLAALLFGNEPLLHDAIRKIFNFNKKVMKNIFTLILSHYSAWSLIFSCNYNFVSHFTDINPTCLVPSVTIDLEIQKIALYRLFHVQ